jgi:TM2 domain-containing membrane protein YozV
MTETPGTPEGDEPTTPIPPPPAGYGQNPYAPSYAAPGYGAPGFGTPAYGASPQAPWGVHPVTGAPYSDKSKLVAGLLQILIPLGIGRFYMGQTGLGVAQLLVTIFTCGLGGIWPFIDGIVILAGDPRDEFGRPLRP